jgi:signal transduction histidine kinase
MGKKVKIWAAGAYAVLGLVILFTAIGERKGPYPSVSDISEAWLDIKTHIFPAEPHLHDVQAQDIETQIETFTQAINRFADSPVAFLYQTHRRAEMRSLDGITAAADKLKAALQNNDREAVFPNILEIDKTIDTLQRVDAELSGTSQLNYFLLFFFFSLLIISIVLVMTSLKSRLEKETQGHERSVTFSRKTVIAQEQERERIALELHDSVAQDLLRLSLQTELIDKTADPAQRSRLCAEVSGGQKELIRHIRNICENLIPPDFERRGLPEALQILCHRFEKRTGIECPVSIHGNIQPGALNSETQFHCFRIVQECLANIEKHAEATEAPVLVRINAEGELLLFVSDNGRGFSPRNKDTCYALRSQGHFGLWNIFERAAFLNGTLTIDSKPAEGTTITLRIPGVNE